ncbi:MAG: amidohydrolase family protein, partial [Pyrinomonadaceae bacterium]
MKFFIRLLIAALFLSVSSYSQTPGSSVPIADHHMHIWSLQASLLVTEPLPPKVELPPELDKLLRDKERLSKQRSVEAIKDLYTDDLVASDAGAPMWLQGERAIRFIAESTVMNTLMPTAFSINGNEGYIAGTEVSSDAKQTPLSNFIYVIRKGSDGKWRVAVETFTMTGPPVAAARTADALLGGMDAAGVRKATVLSVAYWFGNPRRNVQDQYPKVRAENDWVLEQTSKYPGRLYPFFSFNPLSDYAIDEIERCARIGKFAGIKLHIGNGRIDMLNPEHIAKLKAVFVAANKHRLPIVIHLWTSDPKYGAPHSRAFLEWVLPAAPDIPIQIAHMAATGPGYTSDEAMEVFANAAEKNDPRMKNVYFDVASDAIANSPDDVLQLVAKRLRQVGMKRVLFGSDWSPGSTNEDPGLAWRSFRRLPFTETEFRTVANNVA